MSIPPQRCVAILLAAGLSERYPGDKLLADLSGRPLLEHAARTLGAIDFMEKIAVTPPNAPERGDRLAALGFTIMENPAPKKGQGGSLRTGAAMAATRAPAAILLALADMPLVPEAHFRALLARLDPDDPKALAFSQADGWRGPPAAFGPGWLAQLTDAQGDKGARPILAAAPQSSGLRTPDSWLKDFDTPADFAQALNSGPGGAITNA